MIMTKYCITVLVDNWLNNKDFNQSPKIESCVKEFISEDRYKSMKNDETIMSILPCIMGIKILEKII